MFTGIIEAVGKIKSLDHKAQDIRLQVEVGELDMADVDIGDSIAVNGTCLTVVEFSEDKFSADVSLESLDKTTLGQLTLGSKVNLEKAIMPTTRLGGHLVSGHVDGVGKIISIQTAGSSKIFKVKAPDKLAKYIATKGSITIDGVSLTVNGVDGAKFDINIVPHTLVKTIIGEYETGTKVNLEVDLLARYLERLMLGDEASVAGKSISEDFLQENGFV